jgi:hypothetical protein
MPTPNATERRQQRWQQHYDDFCFNELGGLVAEGSDHDRASEYADEQLEAEEDEDGELYRFDEDEI